MNACVVLRERDIIERRRSPRRPRLAAIVACTLAVVLGSGCVRPGEEVDTAASPSSASPATSRPSETIAIAASPVRGTEEQSARLGGEDRLAAYRHLVRSFYRPSRGQARWIDPRPLPHARAAASDASVIADDAWAASVAAAVDHPRICPLEGDDGACRGRAGGVLRFSLPYAVASDTVVIFARYTPVRAGASPSTDEASAATSAGDEMQFWLTRRGGEWRVVREATLEPRR